VRGDDSGDVPVLGVEEGGRERPRDGVVPAAVAVPEERGLHVPRAKDPGEVARINGIAGVVGEGGIAFEVQPRGAPELIPMRHQRHHGRTTARGHARLQGAPRRVPARRADDEARLLRGAARAVLVLVEELLRQPGLDLRARPRH
jgi:hypothetical protein